MNIGGPDSKEQELSWLVLLNGPDNSYFRATKVEDVLKGKADLGPHSGLQTWAHGNWHIQLLPQGVEVTGDQMEEPGTMKNLISPHYTRCA